MVIHKLVGKLSASRIAKLTANGMYGDGGNLWLQVTNNGAGKSWIFRWTERGTGRERNMGLGPLITVDLDDARELAKGYRLMLLQGKDPKAERDNARLDVDIAAGRAKTAGQVADYYFNVKYAPKKSVQFRKNTSDYLRKYVHDPIGSMPIQKVDRHTILETCGLRELYMRRHETAKTVLGHFDRMFQLAIYQGWYAGENPAKWKGGLKEVLPTSRDIHWTQHRPSLPYTDMGRFMEALRHHQDHGDPRSLNVALLIEFVALSCVRVGEARLAQWKEFDLDRMVWMVPWQHLKMGAIHRTDRPIPITKPMLAVIKKMENRRADQTGEAFMFPNRYKAPIRATVPPNFLAITFKWETKLTAHGFRSTLRDWCRANRFPPEWWDIQVDHAIGNGNKASQAYGHDTLLEQRRGMMELWGEYCSKPAPEPQTGDVVVKLSDKKRRA